MSVKDVLKKSFLESEMFNQAITGSTILTIVVDLIVAFLMGLLIYYIYKRFYKGVIFSKNFAITLVGMTILSCMVTLAISTNVVISLGMVGALSIVRYRTAIKEPLDLMYMFWAITTGITVGASMYLLVVLAAVIMIAMICYFSNEVARRKAYIFVVHYKGDETGDKILKALNGIDCTLRSKVMRGEEQEMTLQVNCKNDNTVFAEKVREMDNVIDVVLLEFDGEYHG